MNDAKAEDHFQRLLGIARKARVQVYVQPPRHVEWNGLYVYDRDLGPGIAINEALSPRHRAWVLAHELGHHFSRLNPWLFSPFGDQHLAAERAVPLTEPRRRKVDQDEERANEWAAKALITNQSWLASEEKHPVDLEALANDLAVPVIAVATWERMRRTVAPKSAPVRIRPSRHLLARLKAATTGSGGHQSLFRRVVRGSSNGEVSLTFSDFSLARVRRIGIDGGWREPYEILMSSALPLVVRAGSVKALFGVPDLTPAEAVS